MILRNRLALSILLTSLIPITTSCENFTLVGSVNLGVGDTPEAPALTTGEPEQPCIAYHRTPDIIKQYALKHRHTDKTIDPWVAWLLRLRSELPAEC